MSLDTHTRVRNCRAETLKIATSSDAQFARGSPQSIYYENMNITNNTPTHTHTSTSKSGPNYRICPRCGTKNIEFVMFCRKCGHALVHVENKPKLGEK